VDGGLLEKQRHGIENKAQKTASAFSNGISLSNLKTAEYAIKEREVCCPNVGDVDTSGFKARNEGRDDSFDLGLAWHPPS